MQIPSSQTASEHLILLGQFHLAALEQTSETQPFAEAFRPAQTHLVAAMRARDEALLAYEPKLQGALSEVAARIEARGRAGEALDLARAREDGAKETWIAAYDASAGSLRALFPPRRTQQDLYFDHFRTTSNGNDDADDGVEPADPAGT